MPIKAVIIDDEIWGRKIIREYAASHPDVNIVAECKDAHEALHAVTVHDPELLFLDIQMPEINGFEFLELLEEKPHVIFSTAFDEYAIKAFEINAVDYLLKPFDQERFDTALNRAKEDLNSKDGLTPKLEALLNGLPNEQHYRERFLIKESGRVIILKSDDIVFIEAMDNYVKIHTIHKGHLIQNTLTSLESKLNPEKFVRVHRSYIVSLDKITGIHTSTSGKHVVYFSDRTQIPVSRSGMKRLKDFAL